MASKRECPHGALPLAKRKAIIDAFDSGQSSIAISKAENIPRTTVNNIVYRDRKRILEAFEGKEFPTSRKRMRACNFAKVDKDLLDWFKTAQVEGRTLTVKQLLEKATALVELYRSQGLEEYQSNDINASISWITRWKAKHGLNTQSRSPKCTSNTNDVAANSDDNVASAVISVEHGGDNIETISSVPTVNEAMRSIEVIKNFFKQNLNSGKEHFAAIQLLEKHISTSALDESILQ